MRAPDIAVDALGRAASSGSALTQRLVLVVEDEPKIASIIQLYLEKAGYRTLCAQNGTDALQAWRRHRPDLIVLDVKIPAPDGFEVLAKLREISGVPVIFVTALGNDAQRLQGLRIGADDYVVKPFNPAELVARVDAVLRRASNIGPSEIIRIGVIEIDLAGHAIVVDRNGIRTTIEVTVTQFRLLGHLAKAPRHIHSRADLIEACLPADNDALERTIDSHVSKLRRKLENAGVQGMPEAVRGLGYRLCAR